jgi:hypothetical protein
MGEGVLGWYGPHWTSLFVGEKCRAGGFCVVGDGIGDLDPKTGTEGCERGREQCGELGRSRCLGGGREKGVSVDRYYTGPVICW